MGPFPRGEVVFLADSFTTFTEPGVGIAAVELLHEKYRELIREIEAERDESAAELNRIVAEIGYV